MGDTKESLPKFIAFIDIKSSLKELMIEILDRGHITYRTQKSINTYPSFEMALRDLRRIKTIESNGTYLSGQEKSWKLTKKGIELANLYKKAIGIINRDIEVDI